MAASLHAVLLMALSDSIYACVAWAQAAGWLYCREQHPLTKPPERSGQYWEGERCRKAHKLLCGVMQAESIKLSDKHFDSAVSWYEKAISFLPEEERAKPVKQQIQVCWLHCTMAALLCPEAHPLTGAFWLSCLSTCPGPVAAWCRSAW